VSERSAAAVDTISQSAIWTFARLKRAGRIVADQQAPPRRSLTDIEKNWKMGASVRRRAARSDRGATANTAEYCPR
jgi:hypothetical protein